MFKNYTQSYTHFLKYANLPQDILTHWKMPRNPLLIGYLKCPLWFLIIHDDPWRVQKYPSLSAK